MANTETKSEIRRVNRIGLAKTFGWTVAEIDKMVELGCPYIKRAASKGDEWIFDTADVHNWVLERIRLRQETGLRSR
ncbi:MAG: hypothetical protein E6Q88_11240 [Lysobacteraceae bacterium]|nr:MAG: hypothetical protein E6Q88_11240 [Xanthomonadaceae bacterium]